MPYKVKKQRDKYVVYKKDTGKRVGATAGNKEALRKYLAALHLNANESLELIDEESKGLWANIRAKQARGEKPATKGSEAYNKAVSAAKKINAKESTINLTDLINEEDLKCPPATQDISLNLKNRKKAIDEYGYGPLNPDQPNEKFWQKKADEWNLDDVEEAKSSRCGNCAAFDITKKTLDCIASGIGTDQGSEDPYQVIKAGDLGYCRFLKFKCAAKRTCDAWVVGGPIKS